MSRLLIVSNRVQVADQHASANRGGLAVALSSALKQAQGIWFGWSGQETAEFSGHINFQRANGVTTATIDLEPQDIDEYYNGFANRTIWPLFHYRVDLAEYERGFEGGYARVNERFADTIMPLIAPDDLIWINDYHLIPLGNELRKRGCKNRIGFFLHIPWPPMRLLLSLPSHHELVSSMLAYDVIGFQTQDWLDSFLNYVRGQLALEVGSAQEIVVDERTVRTCVCPIGIDTQGFLKTARSPLARKTRKDMEKSANGRAMVIGVDRLDYSKGLQERFLGYERFLGAHPDLHGKLFLLQIAPPSREDVKSYREIRSSLDELSGRINGEFADALWVPIRYVNKGYPHTELAGIYRAAKIGLVTPLCDGMNLVAKEYVAAQDPDDPGVLILSRFAGAAAQLKDAVLVNPFSAEEIADAISLGLQMPADERRQRWQSMMRNVEQEDVMWWLNCFLSALGGDRESKLAPPQRSLPRRLRAARSKA